MVDIKVTTVDLFHPVSNIIYQLVFEGMKVLDVGCRTGRLGEKLSWRRAVMLWH